MYINYMSHLMHRMPLNGIWTPKGTFINAIVPLNIKVNTRNYQLLAVVLLGD